jgi:hypothetical protein
MGSVRVAQGRQSPADGVNIPQNWIDPAVQLISDTKHATR